MKSCRNCENATHDGDYSVQLICRIDLQVVVPFSNNLSENKTSDTNAQTIAARCKAYKPEGGTQ